MDSGQVDFYADMMLSKTFGQNPYSIRIGNDNVGAQAEQLRFLLPVTSANRYLVYRFASVMHDPNHVPSDSPMFRFRIVDPTSDTTLLANAGGEVIINLLSTYPSAIPSSFLFFGYYTPWLSGIADLSGFVGQNVIIELTNRDCGLGAHFGYTYVSMECYGGLDNLYCEDTFTVAAPEGFEYAWSNGDTAAQTIYYSNNQISLEACTITDDFQNTVNVPFTASFNTQSFIDTTVCDDAPITFAGTLITATGNYVDTLATSSGCDSVINLVVQVDSINSIELTVDSLGSISAPDGFNSYQWINCEDLSSASGSMDGNVFTPDSSGSYSLVIGNAFCEDTLECVEVSVLPNGIQDRQVPEVRLYPNPASETVTIELPLKAPLPITLSNTLGTIVMRDVLSEDRTKLDVSALPPGVYFFTIGSKTLATQHRIIIQ